MPLDCHNVSGHKCHSIEWLCMEHRLDNPLKTLHGKLSNSTATPHRNIDYILSHGVHSQNITPLPIDLPTKSDHRGIFLDIDAKDSLIQNKWSILHARPQINLDQHAKKYYIKYILQQLEDHKIWERINFLHDKALQKQKWEWYAINIYNGDG